MELIKLKDKLPNFLAKYKYALLVILIGVALLLIPSKAEEALPTTEDAQIATPIVSMEEQLSHVLSMIEGAGNVQVLLSIAKGEEYLYQTNSSVSLSANGSEERKDTVTVTDAQRNDAGLLRQVNPPSYLGAVIVCEGADNPAVRLAITEAVARLTGLGTDKISVIKMK